MDSFDRREFFHLVTKNPDSFGLSRYDGIYTDRGTRSRLFKVNRELGASTQAHPEWTSAISRCWCSTHRLRISFQLIGFMAVTTPSTVEQLRRTSGSTPFCGQKKIVLLVIRDRRFNVMVGRNDSWICKEESRCVPIQCVSIRVVECLEHEERNMKRKFVTLCYEKKYNSIIVFKHRNNLVNSKIWFLSLLCHLFILPYF